MKKTQFSIAAAALLLMVGLTACSSDPTAGVTMPPQEQIDGTATVPVIPSEDPEAPQPTSPLITVMDQPDEKTVAEDDKYHYTLAQIGGVTKDGQFLIQVLHRFEPGETIDFRGMDLSGWEPSGEEFLLSPEEGMSYFTHEGEAWDSGAFADIRADDYVILTQDAASGEVYALTAVAEAAEDTTDGSGEEEAETDAGSSVE